MSRSTSPGPASTPSRRAPTSACRAFRASRSCSGEILVPDGARSSILTTFRLLPGLAYDPLHDAMKRRGYVIYAGQGRHPHLRVPCVEHGHLTPKDMEAVVAAFAECLADLGVSAVPTP